jgi:hypothetical protein
LSNLRKIEKEKSLGYKYPEIATQWHPTKNGDITPFDVTSRSDKKYWWKCDKGEDHEWPSSCLLRTGNQKPGCHCCAGKKASKTNSLGDNFPDIAAEWHPTKNGNITPFDVVAGTHKEYWWKCSQGEDHEWEVVCTSRTGKKKSGCPCCSGRKLSKTNSLGDNFTEIAAEWHPTKNGNITPFDVVSGTHKEYWWKCNKGEDHEWPAPVKQRTGKQKSGCHCCAGLKVSKTNSLGDNFPDIAAEWHPTKNGNITPFDVVAGSAKKYWWKCDKAEDHEWETTANSRTSSNAKCSCCAGRKVSKTNSLGDNFPEIAAEWHPTKNGNITPFDVVAGSDKIYWWKCNKGEDHEWEAACNSRTRKRKSGCPCCSGRKLSKTNSLGDNFTEIAAEWHPTKNGNITPFDVVYGSNEKYWWKCNKAEDHEWEAACKSRTGKRKSGCPCCSNSGFNPDKEAIFYLLRVSTQRAYKIGITGRTVKERYRGKADEYESILEIYFDMGSQALEIEKYLKSKYRHLLHPDKSRLTDSISSELFIENIIELELLINPHLFDGGTVLLNEDNYRL